MTGPGGAPVRWLCPGAMEAAAAVTAAGKAKAHEAAAKAGAGAVGLCRLNQVDP